MFILYPVEGLGNRLRAIDSALRYCESVGSRCVVRWYRDKNLLNCRWCDLFEPKNGFSEAGRDYNVLQFVFKLRRHSAIFRSLLSALKKLRILVVCGPDDWDELRDVTLCGKRYLCIIVQTFSIFFWPEGEDFKREEFVLNEEMKSRLNKEVSQFGCNTVGVHIRRTDNNDSIRESPLTLFEKEISRGAIEGLRYYVCSDDASVKDYLFQKFGEERVIIPSGRLDRNSVEGIQQATIELYALSKTMYILGSYSSSFSELASFLGKIKLQMLMN